MNNNMPDMTLTLWILTAFVIWLIIAFVFSEYVWSQVPEVNVKPIPSKGTTIHYSLTHLETIHSGGPTYEYD